MVAGVFSQWLKSRKRAVALNLIIGAGLMLAYVLSSGLTSTVIYVLCFLIGLPMGYWAVLVTLSAEQFGTNIRGTVATTVPNFVRGSAALATSGFAYLKGHMSVSTAALLVGSVCFGLALLALTRIEETFHRNLDYEEDAKPAKEPVSQPGLSR
jgi:putative MFS transporter